MISWRRCKGSRGVLPLLVLLSVAACGSTDPTYYTLSTWPGTPQGGGPLTIEVQTPTVADYLNKDYIVVSSAGGQLHLARNAAWAEPLSAAIGRNLALDLSQRLPGSNVYTANSAIASNAAQAAVAVSISRFAEDDSGQAEITAMLSVFRPNGPVANSRTVHVMMPMNDTGMAALAAALSQLLGQVADAVGQDLRALGPTPSKPDGRRS